MPDNTFTQYDIAIASCRNIFVTKMRDYGTAWRILRTKSITDQIYIKASRIRSIEEKGENRVGEGITPEFEGIINYSVMALIQLELKPDEDPRMKSEVVEQLYDKYSSQARHLMADKNHDYGEAWRQMRISSMTDIILMKLLRIKQIEDNDGRTLISEGLEANYLDIINYSAFALIMLHSNDVE
jgi:ribosomal protein L24